MRFIVIIRGNGETSREKSWQELRTPEKQETHLFHRWHEHGSCGQLRDLSATRSHSPTSGLQALVTQHQRFFHLFHLREILLVKTLYNTIFCLVSRYDSHKLTMKDIHNTHYLSCMNPTSGSFTINPRLQVFEFLLWELLYCTCTIVVQRSELNINLLSYTPYIWHLQILFIISAVKQLIAINRIQNKFLVT